LGGSANQDAAVPRRHLFNGGANRGDTSSGSLYPALQVLLAANGPKLQVIKGCRFSSAPKRLQRATILLEKALASARDRSVTITTGALSAAVMGAWHPDK
jgi:hypothetical protein